MNEIHAPNETRYNPQATEATRRRYQRNAHFYDRMEGVMEKQHSL